MRSGSRCAGGTRYGIAASRILCLARTRRLAIVSSVTMNARAICPVVSPASVRSVRATRASSASAGWQQVKISRSRSSLMPLWSSWSGSVGTDNAAASLSLAVSVAPRRSRSRAR